MTDADALLAHCLDHPDDHSAKLVWLDSFQERHGETPWVQATREFIRICGERRKYKIVGVIGEDNAWGERRALPGWREWLSSDVEWHGMQSRHNVSWVRAGLLPDNWIRLCPSLVTVALSPHGLRWCRAGATIDLIGGELYRNRARLTFARGFLARVEFRDHQSADALLPAILADQPFVECGIRGAIRVASGTATPCAYINSEPCGPAHDLIRDGRRFYGEPGCYIRFDWPNAQARARRALSTALRRRALSPAAASPVPSA